MSSNVTQSYYSPFQIAYMSILLLCIIEAPWAEVSCWWQKIKKCFCTKTAHTFTGLHTPDSFQVLCNLGLSIAPDGS